MMTRLLATATAAVLAAGCGGDSKPAGPEKVAVEWLQAKADYDGGKEWDLTAVGLRAAAERDQAIEKRKREKANECPRADSSGCLFPKDVKFSARGQREEGRCFRVIVRDEASGVQGHEGAVALIRDGRDWRVRAWVPGFPDGDLDLGAARDCGAS